MRASRAFSYTLATWFGSGYAPLASGTVGTAATIPLVLLLDLAGSPAIFLGVTAALILAGIWAGGRVAADLRQEDPGEVVVDEVAGFLVTMALLPVTLGTVVAGFLVFRLADIVKPFPARRLESLPGGFGIMADDLMAGLYSNLVLRAGLYLLER